MQVSFDNSMGQGTWWCFKNFQKTRANRFRYSFLKKLYLTNYLTDAATTNASRNTKIPKIIHQIWLGPNKIPENFVGLMKGWQRQHPDWEYKLWTDNDLQSFNFKLLGQYFDSSINYGQKSDILRYEILYQYGGLYVDIDFECIKPFDKLNQDYHFYCGIHPPHNIIEPSFPLEIGNALIGSIKKHPILQQTCQLIKKRWHKIYSKENRDENWRIVLSTWYPFRDALLKRAYTKNLTNVVLPATFFYPILLEKTRKIGTESPGEAFKNIKEETYAVHHWGECWFNNFIDKNAY